MSYKTLGLMLCTVFALAISCAIAADNDQAQALRMFADDAEKPETVPPGNVIDRTDMAGSADTAGNGEYGGLGCFQSCCCPGWTVTADVMALERVGNRTDTGDTVGREIEVGPRISLIRQTECCDYEIVYFGIDGESGGVITEPNIPTDESPIVGQPVNQPGPIASFGWGSRLYNVEANARWNPSCDLTLLAGFRWAQYQDEFAEEFEFDKQTKNDLYGFQVGADACLWQRGCFSIQGLCKAGVYANHAEQTAMTTPISPEIPSIHYSVSGTHTDFIGEVGLQARYQITRRFALRAGYELLWLDGVCISSTPGLGVPLDMNSTVFYQGGTGGFEFSF